MTKLIGLLDDAGMPEGQLRVVNVHQAKTHLSRLIDEAHAGETIVLAKAGKPWARLMPLQPPAAAADGLDLRVLRRGRGFRTASCWTLSRCAR